MAKKKRIKPKNPVFAELSDKAYNVLSMSAIDKIEDLEKFYPDDKLSGIRAIRQVGQKTFDELTAFLKKHGKTWKQREEKK